MYVRGFYNYLLERYFPECFWLSHMVILSISGTYPILSQNLRVRQFALGNKSTQSAEIQRLRWIQSLWNIAFIGNNVWKSQAQRTWLNKETSTTFDKTECNIPFEGFFYMRLYKASRYVDSSQHYNGLGKYMINVIVNLAFGFNKRSQWYLLLPSRNTTYNIKN
jgi:hypothetical protein